MKFRPILMSTPMVQALQQSLKTVTRRTAGFNVINSNPDEWELVYEGEHCTDNKGKSDKFSWASFLNKNHTKQISIRWPYGTGGDILWVRETFCEPVLHDGAEEDFYYKADGVSLYMHRHASNKWKPGIHMPKEVCRLFLEVKKITVERLNSITPHSAQWEGFPENGEPFVERYITLWETINGSGSWAINPWVWVIKFKQISKPNNFI